MMAGRLSLRQELQTIVALITTSCQIWGGVEGFQCGLVGAAGAAGVFKGWGRRSLTTVDVNTTESALLQMHYFGGTVSQVYYST